MKRPPMYAYAVPLLLGLVAAAAPSSFPFADRFLLSLLVSTGVFGVAGFVCGALWPVLRWRWGLAVIAPGLLLVTAGALTSGDYATLLSDDLPFIAGGLLGAAIGATAGATMRQKAPTQGS